MTHADDTAPIGGAALAAAGWTQDRYSRGVWRRVGREVLYEGDGRYCRHDGGVPTLILRTLADLRLLNGRP